MRQGQKSQSRIQHQRSVGRYQSSYQRGGTIFQQPPNPLGFPNPYKYELEPWILKRLSNQRGGTIIREPFNPWDVTAHKRFDGMYPWIEKRLSKQRGGKVYSVIYPWNNKGRKRINRRRTRR